MLVYKNIIRLIADTDKNYFLLGATQNANKKKFKNVKCKINIFLVEK